MSKLLRLHAIGFAVSSCIARARSGRSMALIAMLLMLGSLAGGCASNHGRSGIYDVRDFGATGGGVELDTDAVNSAILAANRAGGGTVRFPAGTYLCYSIHLQSNVALYLDQGSTILAAEPPPEALKNVPLPASRPASRPTSGPSSRRARGTTTRNSSRASATTSTSSSSTSPDEDSEAAATTMPAGRRRPTTSYASITTTRAAMKKFDVPAGPHYDPPEPNPVDYYQDFGHTHWHNSLIWGEDLHDISITGPGRIDGHNLLRANRRNDPPRSATTTSSTTSAPDDNNPDRGNDRRNNRRPRGRGGPTVRPSTDPAATQSSSRPASTRDAATEPTTQNAPASRPGAESYPNDGDSIPPGLGNKSIALKWCVNVVMRDFSILNGGHFAILATGVDNLTIDNLKIDTNRDGMDIDACRNVRISNCSVNSPGDDGICLKSSYALGMDRATENVTITNCLVSGYAAGTMLDGTYFRAGRAPDRGEPTGRIKFGTESNGGFKNITISNCIFDRCRGLALESVDGGLLEDVTISNITMRSVTNSPIFLRLGARLRGPVGTVVGAIRRVNIQNVVVYDADPRYASIISGIPGHDITDIKLNNIQIYSRGGGTTTQATSRPAELERDYPEPRMFGDSPAYGFFIRHVQGLQMSDVKLATTRPDRRSPFVMHDVGDVAIDHVIATRDAGVPMFDVRESEQLTVERVQSVPDATREKIGHEKF